MQNYSVPICPPSTIVFKAGYIMSRNFYIYLFISVFSLTPVCTCYAWSLRHSKIIALQCLHEKAFIMWLYLILSWFLMPFPNKYLSIYLLKLTIYWTYSDTIYIDLLNNLKNPKDLSLDLTSATRCSHHQQTTQSIVSKCIFLSVL